MSTHPQLTTATRRRWRDGCASPSPTAASRSRHSEALELVAQQHGARDWNTSSPRQARPASRRRAAFGPVIPVLRIFDVAKAREFYSEFLGFAIDWEHTFDDHSPVYLQASRDGALLHLSEHHGDATPGATVRILVTNVMQLHRELHDRDYPYARPGVQTQPWGLEVSCSTRSPTGWSSTSRRLTEPPEGGGTAAARSSTSTTWRARPSTPSMSSRADRRVVAPGLRPARADRCHIEPDVGGACSDAARRRVGVPLGNA